MTILAQPFSPWKQNKKLFFLFGMQETQHQWNLPETFLLKETRERPMKCVHLESRVMSDWEQAEQAECSADKERGTNPKFSPGVPDDPVLSPLLRHTPTSHRHDVIGQRQGVKLWEETSKVFLQATGGHQGTTERQREEFLKAFKQLQQNLTNLFLFVFFSHCFDH